mgnify:CR=1 FL=1
MMINPRREVSILISAICMCGSAYAFYAGILGIGGFLMGISLWVILACEALQLVRVHSEMASMVDKLRQRQLDDTESLMVFLRETMVTAKPFDSLAGVKKVVQQLPFPSFLMSPGFSILAANNRMCELLGWETGELDGVAGHVINDAPIMSIVGEICGSPPHSEKKALTLRYVYLHKSGDRILGDLHLIKVVNDSFFVVFHPDEDQIDLGAEVLEMIEGS